jgi:hypothetical protein
MKYAAQFSCVALALLAGVAVCRAQYRVIQGDLDADGFPTTSARLCLGATGTTHCYTPPSGEYAFGLEPKTQVVAKLGGKDLILFTATFSGGGSGLLTNFALLTTRNDELVNLLPEVQLTNQSEYRLWNLPRISGMPVLATADFIWDFKAMKESNYTEETHFSRHRYTINVYIFDPKNGRYLQRLSYATTKKYPGLDDGDGIRVLNAERTAILARLQPGRSH